MPRTNAPRLVSSSLLVIVAVVVLVACNLTPRPSLGVTPLAVSISASDGASIVISNVGGQDSTLTFSALPDRPWVSLSRTSGTLIAGTPMASVAVNVGLAGSLPPVGSTATIAVHSNGGTATIAVTVTEPEGYTTCVDAYLQMASVPNLPPASPDVAAPPPMAAAMPADVDRYLVFYADAHGVAAQHDRSGAARSAERARREHVVRSAGGAGDVAVVRRGGPGEHDLIRIADHARERVLAALEAHPGVAFVVPDVPMHRLAAPNDPGLGDQWWASCFGALEGWSVHTGDGAAAGAPVVVAVIDDGANVDHADLRDKLLPGYNFADGNTDVRNLVDSHGTHVAGIALASGDNGRAIAGVGYGPNVLLLPIKVFRDGISSTSPSVVIDAMRWSVGLPVTGAEPETNPNPADVVNLSLGVGFDTAVGTSFAAAVGSVVDQMRAQGAVVVAAAGNGGFGPLDYPARLDTVIGVGSVDWTGARSSFSATGAGLDVVAPGGAAAPFVTRCRGETGVMSLGVGSDDALTCLRGTSMAAPFVSGAIALLIDSDPETYRGNPAAIEARVRAAAYWEDGMDAPRYGHGILCPDALLGAPTRCGWPD